MTTLSMMHPFKRPLPRPENCEECFRGYPYESKRPRFDVYSGNCSFPVGNPQVHHHHQDSKVQSRQHLLKRKLMPESQTQTQAGFDVSFIKKRARTIQREKETKVFPDRNGMEMENDENGMYIKRDDEKSNSLSKNGKGNQCLDIVPIRTPVSKTVFPMAPTRPMPLPDPMSMSFLPPTSFSVNVNSGRKTVNFDGLNVNENLNANKLKDQTPAPTGTQLIVWTPPEQVFEAALASSYPITSPSPDDDPMDL